MAKSYIAKQGDVVARWYLVDANGKGLGRLAARISLVLQGKHRPTYTPHVDTGDFVVVINADKVAVTGRKMKTKIYYHNTFYPGGLRSIPLDELMVKKPTAAIRTAVRRMLPRTPLGRRMYSKLKVYAGPEHPHAAQKPEPLAF